MAETWAGRLLVATPGLVDPNFHRTVVLLLDHDEEGALGVVINRPTGVDLDDNLEEWAALAGDPPVVFQGGPVEPTAVLALGRSRAQTPSGGWEPVAGGVRVVDLQSDAALAAADVDAVRVYAGYAGWGPVQVEDEVAAGAWFVVEAEPADVFDRDPDTLWHRVLRRQGGELALLATFPMDPSLN